MKTSLKTLLLAAIAATLLTGCGGEEAPSAIEATPHTSLSQLEQRMKDEGLTAQETSDLMAGYHYCKARGREKLIETLGLRESADDIDISGRVAQMPRWSRFDGGFVTVGCTEALDEETG